MKENSSAKSPTSSFSRTREKSKYLIGTRLADLRSEKKLTQEQFCVAFAEFCGSSDTHFTPTVSAWEQNRRFPTINTLVQLAMFYNSSVDYLFGLSDEKHPGRGNQSLDKIRSVVASDCIIPKTNYSMYDGCPVYVSFINNVHLNQWGILNYKKNKVMCKDFVVSISVEITLYSMANSFPMNRTPLSSIQLLLKNDFVLIEMKSIDPAVYEKYNGRYRHNEDKTMLIKLDTGLTLPYTGLDESYYAFKG